jgi:TetR/AcrR family transcriptional repressor of nem operon
MFQIDRLENREPEVRQVLVGRRKSYDRAEVLDRATRLFWEQGFFATSIRELADAMGVNVYSLYAEFGSKEELYEAALNHYDETIVSGHFGKLEVADAGLDTVRDVARFFGSAALGGNPMLGCLLCNTITERAPTNTRSQEVGARYTERLTRAFTNALTNARQDGTLQADAPVGALAHFLTVSLLGVFVALRAGIDPALMHDTAAHALAQVESYITNVSQRDEQDALYFCAAAGT